MALALANCNEHVAEENITAPAHTQRSLHGAQISRGKSGKALYFPVRDTRARATGISCFPCQTAARSFLRSYAPPHSFLPRALRLQVSSSREIVHMQAGQCGNLTGTDF